MKCAYLNDKNLYVSGKLPIGAKQLRIRVVEGNWIPLEFNNVVLSSLSVFIISKGTLFVDSHLSSFWTHISVVHEMTLTFDSNNS